MSTCHKHSVDYAGKFCPFCSIERKIDELKQQHEMHEHIVEVDVLHDDVVAVQI